VVNFRDDHDGNRKAHGNSKFYNPRGRWSNHFGDAGDYHNKYHSSDGDKKSDNLDGNNVEEKINITLDGGDKKVPEDKSYLAYEQNHN